MQNEANTKLYTSIVWFLSAFALFLYAGLGFWGYRIPGVEELVAFLEGVDGMYLYVAGFLAILIEGTYLVGNVFPGSTLVVILAILSQVGGAFAFVGTILSIFVGWCCAGVINIVLARTYHFTLRRTPEWDGYVVKDRPWVTWYPSFRSAYEVQQITEGGAPWKVFISSVRVKVWASLAAAGYTLLIPLFIDIRQVSNEEGFTSVVVVAVLSAIVGVVQLRSYLQERHNTSVL